MYVNGSARDRVASLSIFGGKLSWPGAFVDFRLRKYLSTCCDGIVRIWKRVLIWPMSHSFFQLKIDGKLLQNFSAHVEKWTHWLQDFLLPSQRTDWSFLPSLKHHLWFYHLLLYWSYIALPFTLQFSYYFPKITRALCILKLSFPIICLCFPHDFCYSIRLLSILLPCFCISWMFLGLLQ